MRKKQVLSSALAIAAALTLTACGAQNNRAPTGQLTQNDSRTTQMTGVDSGTLEGNQYLGERRVRSSSWGGEASALDGGFHANGTLTLNRSMAERIKQLDGVRDARVLISDSNSYVAVVTDDKLSHSNGAVMNRPDEPNKIQQPGAFSLREMSVPGGQPAVGAQTETGRYGSSHYIGMAASDGSIRQYHSSGQINAGAPRFEEARNKDHSHLTSGGTAGPSAAGMPAAYGGTSSLGYAWNTKANGVPSFLKTQIEDIVRNSDTRVRRVFISSEPEFVARTQKYEDRIAQGSAPRTFVKEFNGLAERFFPSVKGGTSSYELLSNQGVDGGTGVGVHRARTPYGIYPSMDNNFLDRAQKSIQTNP